MGWWVRNHIAVNDDETKQLCSIEVDTAADLPAADQSGTAGFIIVRGSDAKDIDTGDVYIMDSSGSWKKQPTGVQLDLTGYATEQYVDEEIAETQVKDFPRFFICTCDTAAGTAQKEIVCDDPAFELKKGVTIAVKSSKSNTASNVSLSVNGTTAQRIWYNQQVYTGSSSDICGGVNRYIFYTFDGTYWVWVTRGAQVASYNAMSQTEATAGTSTTSRVISAKVLHDTIENRLVQPETAIADLYSITTKQEQEITYSIDTGAKNRLLNTQTPGTYNIRDVDFTVLADGTIEVSPGTVTGGNADLSINTSVSGLEVGASYILTGCPDGGSTTGYRLNVSGVGADTGSGREFVYEGTPINVYIRISNGYTLTDSITFKPMIRRAEIKDDSFQPYAPTNRELYEMILALQ